MASDTQDEAERAVFATFAETAGLLYTSLESRKPPEPDIRCDMADGDQLAFELAEIVNPAYERAGNEHRSLRDRFRKAYLAHSADSRQAIEGCLGGPPAVLVGFVPSIPPGRWRHAVEPVLAYLVAQALATGG